MKYEECRFTFKICNLGLSAESCKSTKTIETSMQVKLSPSRRRSQMIGIPNVMLAEPVECRKI